MSITILGIDPGSRVTGYGIIRQVGQRLSYVSCGCIRLSCKELPERLHEIYVQISEIAHLHQPHEGAIEQVFMHQNAGSALKLGHARGAAIVAMAAKDMVIAEYSARQVKQAIVGYGAAGKQQVQHMVKAFLNLQEEPQADAADALAIAICHAHTRQSLQSILQAKKISQGRWK